MSPLKLLIGFALCSVAVFSVSACKKMPAGDAGDAGSPASRGRFVGVGIYTPSESWARVALSKASGDVSSARLSDDQAILVVTDSATGDIRACGDMSGYCVGMNPWRKALTQAQQSPVKLTAHQQDAGPDADATNAASAVESSSRVTPPKGARSKP